jgi:hypothetical protein
VDYNLLFLTKDTSKELFGGVRSDQFWFPDAWKPPLWLHFPSLSPTLDSLGSARMESGLQPSAISIAEQSTHGSKKGAHIFPKENNKLNYRFHRNQRY